MILCPLIPGRQEDDFRLGRTCSGEVLCCPEQAFILVRSSLRYHDCNATVPCTVVPTNRTVREERNGHLGRGFLPEPNRVQSSFPIRTAATGGTPPTIRIPERMIVSGTVEPKGLEFTLMARIPVPVAGLEMETS